VKILFLEGKSIGKKKDCNGKRGLLAEGNAAAKDTPKKNPLPKIWEGISNNL